MLIQEFIKLFKNDESGVVFDYELLNFSQKVIAHKNDIPVLFRFSPADYDNIRNLEMQSLFLSPAGSLNDVFEGLTCTIDDDIIDGLDKLRDIAYIKSFSTDCSNLLMWAHYAESYSGMCVAYDFSNLSNSVLYHLFPIYYSDKKSSVSSLEYTINALVDLKHTNDERCYPNDCDFLKNIMSTFLKKSSVWAYEKEWRIIASYPQIHNTACDMDDELAELYEISGQLFSIRSCIKGVYLGPRMKQRIKDHIKEICQSRLGNIPVYDARISRQRYEIEFYRF